MFKTSLFSFSHSRSSFNFCSSTDRSGSQACKVVSYVYKSNICLITSSASFINIMNNRGPRMDPCGTPIVSGCSSERVRLKLTCWIRLDKYDLNHSSSLPYMPYATSFLSNIPWSYDHVVCLFDHVVSLLKNAYHMVGITFIHNKTWFTLTACCLVSCVSHSPGLHYATLLKGFSKLNAQCSRLSTKVVVFNNFQFGNRLQM